MLRMEQTIEQQAETIVDKYKNLLKTSDLQTCYTGDLEDETKVTAIQCAITEVKACIEMANDSIAFKQTKRDRLNDILVHLKQM